VWCEAIGESSGIYGESQGELIISSTLASLRAGQIDY
jgi:hypothetical protein